MLKHCLFLSAFAATATLCSIVHAQSDYYDSVKTENAQVLRETLHEVIKDHRRYPYISNSTDTWDILEKADENPSDPSRILTIYRNASYYKYGRGNSYYSREHVWPSSYGMPSSTSIPYTDCHNLHLANTYYGGCRGNKIFDNCNDSCQNFSTYDNDGVGGSSDDSNRTSDDVWEVWDERKGDIARTIFYMDVRYEGGIHEPTGRREPDLIVTDKEYLIRSGSNYMGLLSTLLEWHAQDPVDSFERRRNEAVYAFQDNRNPFIDNPKWAQCLYKDECHSPENSGTDWSVVTPESDDAQGAVWINELHYDNSGADVGEFVEVAGEAGTDLCQYQIVGYNGSNGEAYARVYLAGTIPDESNGYGAVAFNFSGLQNGDPDGIALVDGDDEVIQFLSYEGTFTAIDDLGAGHTSEDIGVFETSSTPIGSSLALTGAGLGYHDFSWSNGCAESPGSLNEDQIPGLLY